MNNCDDGRNVPEWELGDEGPLFWLEAIIEFAVEPFAGSMGEWLKLKKYCIAGPKEGEIPEKEVCYEIWWIRENALLLKKWIEEHADTSEAEE
jgi:hypothetical protein